MRPQDITDIFEDCVNRIASGQSIDHCLRAYPAYADILQPLLEAGQYVTELQIPEAELIADQELVWGQIQRQLPKRLMQRQRRRRPPFLLFVLILAIVGLFAALYIVTARPNLIAQETGINQPFAQTETATATVTPTETATAPSSPTQTTTFTPTATATDTPTPTNTATVTDTPTATNSATHTHPPTATASVTHSATPTATHSPTTTSTATNTATVTPSHTPRPSRTPSRTPSPTSTFAPGCGAPLTADAAIARVLEIYPNTTIIRVVQVTRFGGILVWEITTSHQIVITIDVACGNILTIERQNVSTPTISGNDLNGNTNSSNGETANETNSNTNDNSNDNDDDSSGMGSDD